jgi:hypothetical protein
MAVVHSRLGSNAEADLAAETSPAQFHHGSSRAALRSERLFDGLMRAAPFGLSGNATDRRQFLWPSEERIPRTPRSAPVSMETEDSCEAFTRWERADVDAWFLL